MKIGEEEHTVVIFPTKPAKLEKILKEHGTDANWRKLIDNSHLILGIAASIFIVPTFIALVSGCALLSAGLGFPPLLIPGVIIMYLAGVGLFVEASINMFLSISISGAENKLGKRVQTLTFEDLEKSLLELSKLGIDKEIIQTVYDMMENKTQKYEVAKQTYEKLKVHYQPLIEEAEKKVADQEDL